MAETLGQVIRAGRRRLALTQEEFAERLGEGVRQSEVSRLERGFVSQPRPERLRCIAQILDIPVGQLLMLTSWANPELAAPDSARAIPQSGTPAPWRRSTLDDAMDNTRARIEDTRRILNAGNDRSHITSGSND